MKTEIQDPPSPEPDAVAETAASESEALLKDLAEQKDLHLRLAADFENFKRRSRQESEARAVAQKESFIVELLPVIDNLERALPVIMATGILPTWEFALHPCLQAVRMLRMPYTIDKLLGMVKSILPDSAKVDAPMTATPSWPTRSPVMSFSNIL